MTHQECFLEADISEIRFKVFMDTAKLHVVVYMLVIIASINKEPPSVPTNDYTLVADIIPITTLGIKISSPYLSVLR